MAIGICSVLLGLIYVASVFLYLHVKKRKSRNASLNGASPSSVATVKNDQVTFTASFRGTGVGGTSTFGMQQNRSDLMGGGNIGGNSFRGNNSSAASYSGMANGLSGEELGIVKNNPLLKHYPNLNDNSGFMSDMSNSNSEDEHVLNAEIIKNVRFSCNYYPHFNIL